MSISGTTIIKTVAEETPREIFASNFDILNFLCVCTNVKIVYSQEK